MAVGALRGPTGVESRNVSSCVSCISALIVALLAIAGFTAGKCPGKKWLREPYDPPSIRYLAARILAVSILQPADHQVISFRTGLSSKGDDGEFIPTDVRIITASNSDLAAASASFGGRSGTPIDNQDTLAFSVANIPPMIETAPLEQAADAYARMMQGQARFRMVLVTKSGAA